MVLKLAKSCVCYEMGRWEGKRFERGGKAAQRGEGREEG